MKDIIVTIILIAIVAGIIFFLYRSKKRGKKCIGCPYAGQCPSHKNAGNCCSGNNNSGCSDKEK